MSVAVVMVSCLLLSGAVLPCIQWFMVGVTIYNLIVKLNDMKEEMNYHVLIKRKVNLKITLWWIGVVVGQEA